MLNIKLNGVKMELLAGKRSLGTEETNGNLTATGTSLGLLKKRKPVSEPCDCDEREAQSMYQIKQSL